ncbi:MAG: CRISPR-associated protein Csx3 [Candidatus Methanomethylicia archaeon]
MKNLNWLIIEGNEIKFSLSPNQAIAPSELPRVVEAVYNYFSINKVDLIKISGRGPIWLYSAVVHAVAHLAKAIAVYDAINNCYIVVVSHHPKYEIGQIIEKS